MDLPLLVPKYSIFVTNPPEFKRELRWLIKGELGELGAEPQLRCGESAHIYLQGMFWPDVEDWHWNFIEEAQMDARLEEVPPGWWATLRWVSRPGDNDEARRLNMDKEAGCYYFDVLRMNEGT